LLVLYRYESLSITLEDHIKQHLNDCEENIITSSTSTDYYIHNAHNDDDNDDGNYYSHPCLQIFEDLRQYRTAKSKYIYVQLYLQYYNVESKEILSQRYETIVFVNQILIHIMSLMEQQTTNNDHSHDPQQSLQEIRKDFSKLFSSPLFLNKITTDNHNNNNNNNDSNNDCNDTNDHYSNNNNGKSECAKDNEKESTTTNEIDENKRHRDQLKNEWDNFRHQWETIQSNLQFHSIAPNSLFFPLYLQLPELLKVTAELCYEFLFAALRFFNKWEENARRNYTERESIIFYVQGGSIFEDGSDNLRSVILSVYNVLDSILKLMLHLVHPIHRPLVEKMMRDLEHFKNESRLWPSTLS
jgi:hypothetical protein